MIRIRFSGSWELNWKAFSGEQSSSRVAAYARNFPKGHRSFFGPGFEEMWHAALAKKNGLLLPSVSSVFTEPSRVGATFLSERKVISHHSLGDLLPWQCPLGQAPPCVTCQDLGSWWETLSRVFQPGHADPGSHE